MRGMSRSDRELVDGADVDVGPLFDRHAAAVFRYALVVTGSPYDAQDVLQDTFVVAWRKIGKIRLVGDSALPWLLATARFVALDQERARRRRRLDLGDEEVLNLRAASVDETRATTEVADALQALSPIDRELVELVLVDGLTYADAAHQLGLTTAAAGKRLQRARRRLRSLLRPTQSPEGTC